MWNPIAEVHRPIDRIDHPAHRRLRIAKNAFLAQNWDLRERSLQLALNALLAAHVQLQLDVVLGGLVDFLHRPQVVAHHPASSTRGSDGGGKGAFGFSGSHELDWRSSRRKEALTKFYVPR